MHAPHWEAIKRLLDVQRKLAENQLDINILELDNIYRKYDDEGFRAREVDFQKTQRCLLYDKLQAEIHLARQTELTKLAAERVKAETTRVHDIWANNTRSFPGDVWAMIWTIVIQQCAFHPAMRMLLTCQRLRHVCGSALMKRPMVWYIKSRVTDQYVANISVGVRTDKNGPLHMMEMGEPDLVGVVHVGVEFRRLVSVPLLLAITETATHSFEFRQMCISVHPSRLCVLGGRLHGFLGVIPVVPKFATIDLPLQAHEKVTGTAFHLGNSVAASMQFVDKEWELVVYRFEDEWRLGAMKGCNKQWTKLPLCTLRLSTRDGNQIARIVHLDNYE